MGRSVDYWIIPTC